MLTVHVQSSAKTAPPPPPLARKRIAFLLVVLALSMTCFNVLLSVQSSLVISNTYLSLEGTIQGYTSTFQKIEGASYTCKSSWECIGSLCEMSSSSSIDFVTFQVSPGKNSGPDHSDMRKLNGVFSLSGSHSARYMSGHFQDPTFSYPQRAKRDNEERGCASNMSLDFWWSNIPLLRPVLVLNGIGLLLVALHTILWTVHPAARGKYAAAVAAARLLRYASHVVFLVALIVAIILAERAVKNSPITPIPLIVACVIMYICFVMPDALLLFEGATFLVDADGHGTEHSVPNIPYEEDL